MTKDSALNGELFITLPFPPTVNHYWGHRAAKGRVFKYIKAQGKKFRADVIEKLKEYRDFCENNFFGKPSLSVTVYVNQSDRRRRDIDNLSKALLDALEHAGVYEDDCYVDELRLIRDRENIVEDAHVCVSVRRLK